MSPARRLLAGRARLRCAADVPGDDWLNLNRTQSTTPGATLAGFEMIENNTGKRCDGGLGYSSNFVTADRNSAGVE